MPTVKEIIEKYGLKTYKRMLATGWFDGITVSLNEKGEYDIPERDIDRAFNAMPKNKRLNQKA